MSYLTTWSKIDVGIAKVATALGESTIPEILPSHGQHDSRRYIWKTLSYPLYELPSNKLVFYLTWCFLFCMGYAYGHCHARTEIFWCWEITNLFFGVAKFREVVDGIEHCSLVCNTCIKEVLPSALIYTDAFKYQPFWKSWLHRAYLKDWVHMKKSRPHWGKVLFHSTLYDFTPDTEITSAIQYIHWINFEYTKHIRN